MSQTRKDVLNGWKEIAAYLGRDPRTVERWEKQRSLPVRRLPGSGRSTVYALVAELDEWLASTPLREAEPAFSEGATGPPHAQTETEVSGPRHADVAAVGRDGGRLQRTADGRTRTRRWQRWLLASAALAFVCWAGLATPGWTRRHPEPEKASSMEPGRLRHLVPSSPVVGVEELYLRGCYQAERRTPESLHQAQEAFRAAIRKDPRYAPAFAGLASSFLLLREYCVMPDAEAYPRAREAAVSALQLDPELPEAHAVMGFVNFFWGWDGVAAEKEFHQALQLDPSLPLAHHWYGSVLTHEGRFGEGLKELTVAQRLDPSSAAILTTRALAVGLSGQPAQATDMLQAALTSDTEGQYRNPATMHQVLAILSLLPPRNLPRYLAEDLLTAELRRDAQTAALLRAAAGVYHAQGERAMWRALLAEEQKRHAAGGCTYAMARYEAELGAKDQAMNDLADLFSRHDSALIGISVDPLLASLSQEPRFLQLRAAMGLPATQQN